MREARYRVGEEAEKKVHGHKPIAIGFDGKRVLKAIEEGSPVTQEQLTLVGWDGHRYQPEYYGYSIAAEKFSKCFQVRLILELTLQTLYNTI